MCPKRIRSHFRRNDDKTSIGVTVSVKERLEDWGNRNCERSDNWNNVLLSLLRKAEEADKE